VSGRLVRFEAGRPWALWQWRLGFRQCNLGRYLKKAAFSFLRVEARAYRLIRVFFNLLGSSFKPLP
jgi:hypothetical protein